MEKHTRFDKDIFHFKVEDNKEQIFYTKEVKQLQGKDLILRYEKEDKDNIIPLEEKMFRTT